MLIPQASVFQESKARLQDLLRPTPGGQAVWLPLHSVSQSKLRSRLDTRHWVESAPDTGRQFQNYIAKGLCT